jgi:hypothetical protein
MGKRPTHVTSLRVDQAKQIALVRALRAEVADLRSKVSVGSYGDDEVKRLWKLAETASLDLHIANPELAERAGLGANFFTTIVRDKRRPKLQNFLRALNVLFDVANERLANVDNDEIVDVSVKIAQRIRQDRSDLLELAQSLSKLALDEIDRIDAERPNDPETVASYEKQRELLKVFADGFARIARALAALDAEILEPVKLRKATKVIEAVGDGISKWWKENGEEAIDWGVRLPVLTAGVAALGWAGAPMYLGTSIVAALVGGGKVMKVMSRRSSKEKKRPGSN